MSGFRVSRGIAAIALVSAAALAAACGGGDDGPRRPQTASGGTGAAGGEGGDGGDGDEGGGGAAPGACGNGVVERGEACDGPDLGDATCQRFGFEGGELRCSPDCTADTSGCTGVEACQDGRDNDGDGSADCGDPECEAACADMCAAPVALADPATVTGDTRGHAAVEGGCTAGAPGVAYSFTATTTGFLDVVLTPATDAGLVAVLRGACDDAATERACGGVSAGAGIDNRLTVPVREGDAFYVVVSGANEGQAGAFELAVRSRETVCGDRIQDPAEECDNLLDQPDDGCSDDCRLQATEVEPNDDITSANPYAAPFFASIDPLDDVDVVRVTVPSGPTALIAETADVTSSDCLNGRLDTMIDILDESGAVLVQRDFGGVGHCARAVAPALAAGDYYVRVAANVGPEQRAPYRLDVTLVPEVCGDGDVTYGEQCDDGNTTSGDGCSAACRFELHETEPNDTPAQADAHAAPWLAEISPAGDVDVVTVNVPGSGSTLIATVSDNGTEACMNGRLDSYVEILGDDGATVLASDDDAGAGYCSSATATDLAEGTYHVRVRAADIVPDATFFYRLNVTVL
ncbi:DUF4215 domain-containing protein [Sorangium sp. So ce1335]|uniref:DUF4215 domain-containing protein n=1 Tax=Sorangium sp. So ce1335 TaxID=3133335 RepID=UPI003F6211B2